MRDIIRITKTKAGKDKGKRVFVDPDWKRDDKCYNFIKSKYRKRPSNRFYNQKRFLSQLDMGEAKFAEAVTNSKIKRGEIVKGNYAYHYVCGCGVEGCIGHNEITKQ